jgi:DNA invertase Pin-like site-specific DNA recombinase
MAGRKLSKEQLARIVQLYRDGEKLDYIATIMGVSMSTVHRLAKAAGLRRGHGNRTLVPIAPA